MENRQGMPIRTHCVLACIYFLLLPLTIATNASGDSLLKIMTVPIGLYFVWYIITYPSRLQINLIHLLLAAYTVSTTIAVLVRPVWDTVSFMIGYFLNAALFICLSVVQYNERELRLLEQIQPVLLAIITLLVLLDEGAWNGRTTLSILGQASDPNYFVGYTIFPLAVTMKRIVESRWRVLYMLLAAASVYTVFLSGSRGGLLAVLMTITAFALFYPKGLWKKLTVLLLLLVSVLLLWFALRPLLPQMIVERMSVQEVISSGGTHRADIWRSMLGEIKDGTWQVLFGRGLQSTQHLVLNGRLQEVVAHNHYIQLMYDQGVIGVLLFGLLVGACLVRCAKKQTCVAVAMIGMLALGMSLSFNPSVKTFWNLIAYAAFVLPKDHRWLVKEKRAVQPACEED